LADRFKQPGSWFNVLLAVVAPVCIVVSLWHLHVATEGVTVTALDIEGTPARVYRPAPAAAGSADAGSADARRAGAGPPPVVVIAHGFAGSQQLMQSFGYAFARNGYIAVTFDFPGHGRNPQPLTGSITDLSGATRTLLASLTRVAAAARPLGDGRLAVLGHSMASDIVVRYAEANPDVAATIAVSMFSPAVTATAPRNLLIIDGAWEGMLRKEALRAVSLETAPAVAREAVTYGDFANGTARRAAVSPHVEHVSVLFSVVTLRQSLAWLDAAFGVTRATPPVFLPQGPWIMLLFAGIVLLARPLGAALPRVSRPAVGAGLPWRRLWLPLALPCVLTPVVLRGVPTHFLPVLVADYLAVHFALYGLLTALCLGWAARAGGGLPTGTGLRAGGAAYGWRPQAPAAFVVAVLSVLGFSFVAVVWPINAWFTSFVPGRGRVVLIGCMLVGTLLYFLSDEWLTRGPRAARGAYATSKLAFLVSLAVAVALDFERLFFLAIIVPVIVLFFWIYGLFSAWTYRATGHPWVAAIAHAVVFAWALGVTFPLLAG
jgi:pimeloyl-ACP methyl ester carboxylesterase